MTGLFVQWNPKRKDSPGWIEDGSGCHIWTGRVDRGGYGVVGYAGKITSAHRARWIALYGPVPDGMELDHFACNNRTCCNPAHLRPVTRRENALRGTGPTAANAEKTHCLRGHALIPDNLVPHTLRRRGDRECRECYRARKRRSYRERQAKRAF